MQPLQQGQLICLDVSYQPQSKDVRISVIDSELPCIALKYHLAKRFRKDLLQIEISQHAEGGKGDDLRLANDDIIRNGGRNIVFSKRPGRIFWRAMGGNPFETGNSLALLIRDENHIPNIAHTGAYDRVHMEDIYYLVRKYKFTRPISFKVLLQLPDTERTEHVPAVFKRNRNGNLTKTVLQPEIPAADVPSKIAVTFDSTRTIEELQCYLLDYANMLVFEKALPWFPIWLNNLVSSYAHDKYRQLPQIWRVYYESESCDSSFFGHTERKKQQHDVKDMTKLVGPHDPLMNLVYNDFFVCAYIG